MKRQVIIDLFSGPGGLSLGFTNAGYDLVIANDISGEALNTLKLNHPQTVTIKKDIAELSVNELKKTLKEKGYNTLDGIVGGPPCQGFSMANMQTRFLDNPKNNLFKEYLRIVKGLRPRFIVLENVVGLLSMGQGQIKDAIINELENIGYTVEIKVLNAADYGVPQLRKRVVFIANLDDKTDLHPAPLYGDNSYISVNEAISDLPSQKAGYGKNIMKYTKKPKSEYQKHIRSSQEVLYNHVTTKNSDLVIERYKHIPQGGNWQHIPEKLMKNYKNTKRCHSSIYRRLEANKPSITISNFRKSMFVHPTQNRGLSVREAARIQSFPDWYQFSGTINAQQQQLADAVPPLMASAIAENIKTKLYGTVEGNERIPGMPYFTTKLSYS